MKIGQSFATCAGPIPVKPPLEQTYLSTCPVCQKQIDVTSLEPFTKLKCPHCGTLVRVRRNFDHFRIVRQIGEGGMSRVFEAEDETLGRRVALKILNRQYGRDALRVEQFKKEALVTAKVSHLNVIKLYTVGEDQGYFYIAMELVSGGSLEQRIRQQGHLPEEEVLHVGLQVAEGLRAAQKEGLIHRDVKPANILFTETGVAKVVDFGLALFAEHDQDQSGEIWATPYYVAPEKVIDNKEDYRSDIFSLGASLYHALTGRPPHKANTNSILELRMIKCRRVALEDSGMQFAARTIHAINKMVAFSPEERFADYDKVVDELRLAEGLASQPDLIRSNSRVLWFGGAVLAVLAIFVISWVAKTSGDRRAKSINQVVHSNDSLLGGGVTVGAGQGGFAERFTGARDLILQGQYEEALKRFTELIDQSPDEVTRTRARFHAAICATSLSKKQEALALYSAMAGGGAGDESAAFFKRLGTRMADRFGADMTAAKLGYKMDSEQILGYLAHGLGQWYFGDASRGADLLDVVGQEAPALTNSNSATAASNSVRWVPDYIEKIISPLRSQIAIAREWANRPKPEDLSAVQASLAQLDSWDGALPNPCALKLRIADDRQKLQRELSRLQADVQRKTMSDQRARRQREVEQFTEICSLLPSLVDGYDYTRAMKVLEEVRFDSPEVQDALDGRRYLYHEAQSMLDQLALDLAKENYDGVVQRLEGPPLTARVQAIQNDIVTLRTDRGSLSLPLDSISPETLVEMAQKYASAVTDSTDYYLRKERIAVFARVAGLQDLSSTLAAELMEENRGFRQRWLRVL